MADFMFCGNMDRLEQYMDPCDSSFGKLEVLETLHKLGRKFVLVLKVAFNIFCMSEKQNIVEIFTEVVGKMIF